MLGKFITLEGTEGAGKSTALHFIEQYFLKKHQSILITREPGGTEIAEQIRQILLHTHSQEKLYPDTELLLMFAARAQHIAALILPALQQGQWVISDRYLDASYAYQGGGRGMDEKLIATLDCMIVKNCRPDLTLLLNVPAEVGMQRAQTRGTQKDRIEQEHIDFFVRVQQTYLARAKAEAERIKIIDASQPIAAVESQIQSVLDQFMASIAT